MIRALATARLIRFLTTDALGDVLIVRPAKRWAGAVGWRNELVSGLECPFCIGFWVGLIVLALPDNRLVRWVLRGLALNYVVAHVSSRIDDVE